jgi:hypothetical protein
MLGPSEHLNATTAPRANCDRPFVQSKEADFIDVEVHGHGVGLTPTL